MILYWLKNKHISFTPSFLFHPSFLSPSFFLLPLPLPTLGSSLSSSAPSSLSPGVLQTYQGSYFGTGTVPMLIGNLYCFSYASQLSSCYGITYRYIPSSFCSPYSSHVAGVKCIGKYTVVCKVIREYARVCKLSTLQSCSRSEVYGVICKVLQEYEIVCKSVQGYASSPHSSL